MNTPRLFHGEYMIYNCLRCEKEFESSILTRKHCSRSCAAKENKKAHSAGGKAQGAISKTESLKKYNDNPNVCKYCSKIIAVQHGQRVADVRNKIFCDAACSARFNNPLRIKPKGPRFCKVCLTIIVLGRRIVCDGCKDIELGRRTKGDLFETRSNWQSARSSIRRHAALVWKASGKKLECEICGYDLYVEIAHIKAVSEFPDGTLVQQINAIDNLKALCPNHHWEFDNLSRG